VFEVWSGKKDVSDNTRLAGGASAVLGRLGSKYEIHGQEIWRLTHINGRNEGYPRRPT